MHTYSADGTHILHAYGMLPDPLLALHLKRMSWAREWAYQTQPMGELAQQHLDASDIVVIDFFARPAQHQAMRGMFENLLEESDASFLFVFPRTFSSSIEPLGGVNCEYCFLGLNGIEEITLRVDLARARSRRFHPVDALA